MELAFGTDVREHFYSIGRLAGLEADQQTHEVRNILVSAGRVLDDHAEKRSLAAIPGDHFSGDIDLRPIPDETGHGQPGRVVTLTDATRLMREGREIGHLVGVEIDPATGGILTLVGQHHWWTPRVHIKAAAVDFSVPGEIRVP